MGAADSKNKSDGFVALYSYKSHEKSDLNFKKGDVLRLIKEMSNGWYECENLTTGKRGLAPSNYLDHDLSEHACQKWWMTCSRMDSERILSAPGNSMGTFHIRNHSEPHNYVLSVRNFIDISDQQDIRHYIIKFNDDKNYFITSDIVFPSLPKLVEYYKKKEELCCKLTRPCPRKPELVPFVNLEVDRKDIKKGKLLGKGGFGEVYMAFYKKRQVAIKQLIPNKLTKEELLQEAKNQHKMRHKNLVQLMGVCTDSPMIIIMEYLEKGSLESLLRKDYGKIIKFPVLLNFAAQVACGMTHLEESGYIHRDIRSANILVGANNEAKIGDFGLSKLDDVYEGSESTMFPALWASLEIFESQKFSIKSDVWSYGILLYEIFTYAEIPYKRLGIKAGDVYYYLKDGKRLPNPSTDGLCERYVMCPDNVYEMMFQCWESEPNDRPSFAELLDFFENYKDWGEAGIYLNSNGLRH